MEDCRNLALPGVQEQEDVLDKPLTIKNPDLYYGNLHIECYYFCQQCKDHFETAGVKSHKRIPFAASFLKARIFFYWQQYKNKIKHDRATPPSWQEFKAFFQRNLGESTAFVDNIWSKIKKHSQYQLEEFQDWAAYLEHFQLILIKFNADCALLKVPLGRYFYKKLRPSIKF